jgi:ADP-ribose pyrophosphatase YjhB (NUDIX family)
MNDPKYTIRVYAIILNEVQEVLLMNESYRGIYFTKFPGGGLEWGEGLRDCVNRELEEELGLTNLDLDQFYTTDFFVESYFDTTTQVISVYYITAKPINKNSITLMDHDTRLISCKWVPLQKLRPNDVTFPIDKKVVEMLLSAH